MSGWVRLTPVEALQRRLAEGISDDDLASFLEAHRLWFEYHPEDRDAAEALIRATPTRPSRPWPRSERRGPGRPGWTQPEFWAAYTAAKEAAGPGASEEAIADQFASKNGRGIDPSRLRTLVREHGRPPDKKAR